MGTALVTIIPSVLWFLLVVWLLYHYRDPLHEIFEQASKRIKHFKIGPFEVSLAELQEVIKSKSPEREMVFASQVLARAHRNSESLQGAKILWVDDVPSNNFQEADLLRKMGASTSWATSNDDALQFLKGTKPDVVISDIARGNDIEAGLKLPVLIQEHFPSLSLIFYTGYVDRRLGTPPYAFAITNHPDELLNYVMDVLERVRPPTA